MSGWQDKPRIYRYELEVLDSQRLYLPAGARILKVAPTRRADKYLIDLWALVPAGATDGAGSESTTFRVFGTGHPLPDFVGGFTYLDTAIMSDGLVWHVFTERI